MWARASRRCAPFKRTIGRGLATDAISLPGVATSSQHGGSTVWQLRLGGERARNAARPERLEAVVLDWSGTVTDNWVTSVSSAFCDVWHDAGVPITMDEARAPMGLSKELHLKAIAEMPRVAGAWRHIHGDNGGISAHDLRRMFRAFVPHQLARLRDPAVHALLPGTVAAVDAMRRAGYTIGMTTGFQRSFVDELSAAAARQGFVPDVNLAADDVARPRPFPDMILANAARLKVSHLHAILKVGRQNDIDAVTDVVLMLFRQVDDTRGGIGEGLSAGCWTCGVAATSVYMNIDSLEQGRRLDAAELRARCAVARQTLLAAGAHYVVDDIRGVPAVADLINRRLQFGDRP